MFQGWGNLTVIHRDLSLSWPAHDRTNMSSYFAQICFHILHKYVFIFCTNTFSYFAQICFHILHKYSLVHLVWPNTESLISQPFMGLSKIRLLLQDPVSPRYVRFFWRYHIFHLLFCPTHAHIIRSSMGVAGSICSEAGRLDLFAEK